MIVSMIAAVAEDNVIGYQGKMPWHLPNDLKYFKETTMGHHIIMGRKTFESFARKSPLAGRTNIVVTRNPDYQAEGIIAVGSLEEALVLCEKNGEAEAFIIGGEKIYEQGIRLSDKLYITRIFEEFMGDTYFPDIGGDWGPGILLIEGIVDEKNKYKHQFEIYEREF